MPRRLRFPSLRTTPLAFAPRLRSPALASAPTVWLRALAVGVTVLISGIASPGSVAAYNVCTDPKAECTHETMTMQALYLYLNSHPPVAGSVAEELQNDSLHIQAGVAGPDQRDVLYGNAGIDDAIVTINHFWSPDKSLGAPMQFNTFLTGGDDYPNAFQAAKALWTRALGEYASGKKEKAYEYLGMVAHFLGDQTIPTHAHNDTHGPDFLDYDAYEEWMSSVKDGTPSPRAVPNADELAVLHHLGVLDIPIGSVTDHLNEIDNRLLWLFLNVNQTADFFASDGHGFGEGYHSGVSLDPSTYSNGDANQPKDPSYPWTDRYTENTLAALSEVNRTTMNSHQEMGLPTTTRRMYANFSGVGEEIALDILNCMFNWSCSGGVLDPLSCRPNCSPTADADALLHLISGNNHGWPPALDPSFDPDDWINNPVLGGDHDDDLDLIRKYSYLPGIRAIGALFALWEQAISKPENILTLTVNQVYEVGYPVYLGGCWDVSYPTWDGWRTRNVCGPFLGTIGLDWVPGLNLSFNPDYYVGVVMGYNGRDFSGSAPNPVGAYLEDRDRNYRVVDGEYYPSNVTRRDAGPGTFDGPNENETSITPYYHFGQSYSYADGATAYEAERDVVDLTLSVWDNDVSINPYRDAYGADEVADINPGAGNVLHIRVDLAKYGLPQGSVGSDEAVTIVNPGQAPTLVPRLPSGAYRAQSRGPTGSSDAVAVDFTIQMGFGDPDSAFRPPVAVCKPVQLSAGPNCTVQVSTSDLIALVNNGSHGGDVANHPVTFAVENVDTVATFRLGDNPVRLRVTDTIAGLHAFCEAIVTVVDATPPVFAGVGADLTIQCDQSVVFSTPTASDNCATSPVLTFVDVTTAGSCAHKKDITRTWTALDSTGNVSKASQTIHVVDTTAPVFAGVGAGFTIECDQPVVFSTPTASDNCDASPVLTFADVTVPGSCAEKVDITRSWTAKDACGNAKTASQTIHVVDRTAPVIASASTSIAMLWPPNHTMRDVTINYTTSDNCAPSPSVTTQLSVASNEPINGVGDGDTSPDWEVVDNHHVRLRAERAGTGGGRLYAVTITATDPCGNASSKSVSVVVAHNIEKPVSGTPFKVNTAVDFAGTFWDVAGRRHTAQWTFDDLAATGTVVEPAGMTAGTASGRYTFTASGIYKVMLTLTDQAGARSSVNTAGDVEAIAVVYDPGAGYAIGGGWFASPAGAYKAVPGVSGKVSYGFTSQYFKGATKPKGEAQFGFNLAGLEFNALNFDYLVISGAKAQFKGSGKLNGEAGYDFTLTAIDGELSGGGGTDRVRMKIWRKSTGAVVYDSQPGASDAADPTVVVGAGSSVVIVDTNVASAALVSARAGTGDKAALAGTGEESALAVDAVRGRTFSLSANRPNPFGSTTDLQYSLPEQAHVELSVFDVRGAQVRVLVDGTEDAGDRSARFDAGRLEAGLYFVRLRATSVTDPTRRFSQIRKMLMLK